MFIKFNSESKVDNTTKTASTQKQPVTKSQSNDNSFYDIYAQQILKSGVAPIIQNSNTASEDNNGYDDLSWMQAMSPPPIPQIQNSQGTSAVPVAKSTLPADLDIYSIFGLVLGKKVPYIEPETNTVQEGIVKQVSVDEQKVPYFELEDGTIVRLEKVNPINEN